MTTVNHPTDVAAIGATASPTTTRLMHVDDDPVDRELFGIALQRASADVELLAFGNVADALTALRSGAPLPNVIVIDLNLPGRDGASLVTELKGDASLCVIPAVVLSSTKAEAEVRRCYEVGANAFVRKPSGFTDYVALAASIVQFWGSTAVTVAD